MLSSPEHSESAHTLGQRRDESIAPGGLGGVPGGLPARLTELQRAIGNQAVLRLLMTAPRGGRTASVTPQGTIQRVLLGKERAKNIENQLSDLIDAQNHTAKQEQALDELHENITTDMHDYEAIAKLRDASVNQHLPDLDDIADSITVGGPRSNYYPSGFNITARNNRDMYLLTHPAGGKKGTNFKCPGNGVTAKHTMPNALASIDHIKPVAWHWNKYGYVSDLTTRVTWFNDITNHEIMCRNCNSSKGSGGVLYTKQPDYNNGFKLT